MSNSQSGLTQQSPVKTIFLMGLVAGCLDISAAIILYSYILQKVTAEKLLQGIASGVFRERAYTGGIEMAIYGLAFHFLIAYLFAICYFLLFPYLPFLRKHKIINGLIYGVLVWLIMNLAVLPLLFPDRPYPTWDSFLIGASILMVMIGLPISLITSKYYISKKSNQIN